MRKRKGKEKKKEKRGREKRTGKGKRGRKKGKKMGKRKRERKEKRTKGKEKGKRKGRWKLKKCWTHGHKGDFILCPMLCIALDRQKLMAKDCIAVFNAIMLGKLGSNRLRTNDIESSLKVYGWMTSRSKSN